MVFCVFARYFFNKEERDSYVPTIEDVLTDDANFIYKFVNICYTDPNTAADKFLGELITKHVSHLNAAFFYCYGYFEINVQQLPRVVYNYRDLILPTHNCN